MTNTLSRTILLACCVALPGSLLAQQSAPAKPATTTTAKKPATTTAAKPATAAAPALKTDKEKRSYAIGSDIGQGVGKSLKTADIDVDKAVLLRGFKDAINDAKLALTDEEIKTILTQLNKDAREHAEAKAKAAADKTQKDGDAFLAANKTKPGVVTLPSGLQYKIIKQGEGPKPAATDSVECNYKGTFIDGKEFDSTEKHGGKPATFPVNRVISGWTEVLQLMPEGSKYQVFIPASLAYGQRGAGNDIPPNSALVFEIELLKVLPKQDVKPVEPAKPAEPTK